MEIYQYSKKDTLEKVNGIYLKFILNNFLPCFNYCLIIISSEE